MIKIREKAKEDKYWYTPEEINFITRDALVVVNPNIKVV
jgi:hypothetical protein